MDASIASLDPSFLTASLMAVMSDASFSGFSPSISRACDDALQNGKNKLRQMFTLVWNKVTTFWEISSMKLTKLLKQEKGHLLTIGSASAVNLSLNTLTASSVSTFNMARTRQAEPLTNPSCWYWADHINWDMIFSLTTPISASASIAAALTLCEWSSDIRSRRPSITSWSENLSCPAPWTIWIVRIMMELVDKIQQNHDVPCSPIYRIPRFTGLHKK